MSNHLTVKHRATEPVPVLDRPASATSHRAGRNSDLPIAAALGILLLLVAAFLAIKH